MINLDVAPYCSDCNAFEVEVTKSYPGFYNDVTFDVHCVFRDRCAVMYNHIKSQENKKEEKK